MLTRRISPLSLPLVPVQKNGTDVYAGFSGLGTLDLGRAKRLDTVLLTTQAPLGPAASRTLVLLISVPYACQFCHKKGVRAKARIIPNYRAIPGISFFRH